MLEYQLIVHLSTVVLYITRCEGLVFLVTSWSTFSSLQILLRELRTATTHDHVQAEKEDIQGPYTTGSAHGGGDGGIQTLQSATVLL